MSEGRSWGRVEGAGRIVLVAMVAAAGSACFDGAAALGLPCRTDDECGNGQRCEQGFCGGPPSTTGEPGGSSTSTGDGPGSSSSSGEADSSSGGSTGEPMPRCGDNTIDPGEDCDVGGVDSVDCDADCTWTACGDGHHNLVAGEHCDDGNGNDVDECTSQCQVTLFFDDMEDDAISSTKWTTEVPMYNFDGTIYSLPADQGWNQGLPGMPSVGVWHSGPYSDDPGTARLLTVPIDFPATLDPGLRYELRFTHTLRFDGNDIIDHECGGMSYSDGGIVWLKGEAGNPERPLGPTPGDGFMLTDPGSCTTTVGNDPNPLFVLPGGETPPVYSGVVLAMEEVQLVIDNVAGTSQQIVFEVGYDCANCWDSTGLAGAPAPGWVVDNVVIAPF